MHIFSINRNLLWWGTGGWLIALGGTDEPTASWWREFDIDLGRGKSVGRTRRPGRSGSYRTGATAMAWRGVVNACRPWGWVSGVRGGTAAGAWLRLRLCFRESCCGASPPATRCSWATCHTEHGALHRCQRVEQVGQSPRSSGSCARSMARQPSVRRGSSERATDTSDGASARLASSESMSRRSHTALRRTCPRISSTWNSPLPFRQFGGFVERGPEFAELA